MEKAHRMREEAMREDDNVFDVAFEGMGNDDATVSATDIKVGGVDSVLGGGGVLPPFLGGEAGSGAGRFDAAWQGRGGRVYTAIVGRWAKHATICCWTGP